MGLALPLQLAGTARAGEPVDLRARYESAAEFAFWNLEIQVPGLHVEPEWSDRECAFRYRRTGAAPGFHDVDAMQRRERRVPDLTAEPRTPVQPGMSESPDGRWGLRVVEGNLVSVSLSDGVARPLTTDGTADYAYGLAPDVDLAHLGRLRAGQPESPNGVWSPDGRRFLTYRVDQRSLPELPMVLSVQPGREHQIPRVHAPRIPLPGDPQIPRAELLILDPSTGERVDLTIPPLMMLFESLPVGGLAWSENGERVFATHWSRDFTTQTFYEADAHTGAARVVAREESRLPNRQVLHGDNARVFTRVEDSNDLIVRSVRDGWAHFYLYDARTGQLRNRITHGEWSVHEIKWVDRARRILYFTAGGREAGRDPYYPHLYRVGFDGIGLRLLTPENADHEVDFSPRGRCFIDTYSTVSEPPLTRVRAHDGRLLMTLEPADATYVTSRGWTAPRRERVKAADGATDIWASLFFPPDFDSRGSYPVIEVIYAGSQAVTAPTRFLQDAHPAIPLTRLGFIVVVVDGRGTPLRSQAFQDFSFGEGFGAEAIVADHVAAIRQLAQRYPAIDLHRLGIYGHSWGGYRAARAMFQFPDFYAVGVASAGSHDNFLAVFDSDRWLGMARPGSASYALQSNLPLAAQLRGKLLLIHGEADEIVHPANTLQLAHALIEANRPFDLLIYPDRGHADLKYAGYFNRRVWDYFVTHLLGLAPTADVRVPDRGEMQRRMP